MLPFPPAVVLCIEDLLFSERMADAVRHLGGTPVAADSKNRCVNSRCSPVLISIT